MIRALPLGVGVAAALGAVWSVARLAPPDLALRPEVGGEYRLVPYGGESVVPVVLRLESVPCIVPRATPCASGWPETARAQGELIEVEAGTHAGLFRVEGDEFQHPALRVRLLDGRRAGLRGFVSRWHLRRQDGAGPLGLALLGAVAAAAGIGGGGVSAALLTLVRSRAAAPPG